MPTLAEFHTLISQELNKGTSLDTYIPSKVRQAARLLEDNYEFDYMKTYQTFTLAAGDRAFLLPTRYKSMIFLRLTYSDEEDYRYLKKVDPRQVTMTADDADTRPIGWWLDGDESIRLDAEIQESTPSEIYFNRYSDWPVSPYASTPKVLEKGEVALLNQTMVLFGPFIRNAELHQQYKDGLSDALRILTGSQMTGEQGGASPSMEYR